MASTYRRSNPNEELDMVQRGYEVVAKKAANKEARRIKSLEYSRKYRAAKKEDAKADDKRIDALETENAELPYRATKI